MRLALMAALATAVAIPAAAQVYERTYVADGPYVDEVVVAGRAIPRDPNRLSRTVDLRDLDLTTPAGQDVMRIRVRDTARDVCRTLGEGSGNGGPLMRSCEEDAIRSARPQMRVAVNQAYARATAYAYLDVRNPYPYD